MKSPNESNIDEWLFHYFEGDLSPSDESVIEEFLLEHPQYDAQFEAWGASRIQQESFVFPKQESLAKPLIPFGMLHQVAVYSAIVVNAMLAGFIIFGNREINANYNAVQLQEIVADEVFSTGIVSTENQTNTFISDASFSLVKNQRTSYKNNFNTPRVSAQVQRQISISGYSSLGLENAETLADNTIARDQRTFYPAEQFPNPEQDVSFEKYINSSGLVLPEKENGESELNAIALLDSDDLESKEIEHNAIANVSLNSDVGQSNSSTSGENRTYKSDDSRSREPKESRTPLNPIRFRGGKVLLTNTRSQEYLIPGANRNQINFAHVGSDFSSTAYSNAYAQWPGKDNQLFTNQLGYDVFIPQIKSGLGIQMMYSSYGGGSVRDFETSLTYSPKIFLTKNLVLEPAVRLRMSSTGVNRGLLSPGSWIEFDRGNAFQYSQEQHDAFVNRSIQQDLGFGLLLNSKWGFVGINADHVMGNTNHALHYDGVEDVSRAPMFVNAVLGTEYESLNGKLLWSGQMIYQNHGQLNKIWLGSRIKYNYLSLGASVSSMGEPMFSAGFVAKGISIMYSGDYSYSRMYNDKFLSHQLLLRITLKESRMKKLMLN